MIRRASYSNAWRVYSELKSAHLVQEAVTALSKTPSSSSILVSVISFLALLFAASGLFFQLQYSLNKIWRVPPPQKGQTTSFIRQRLFSFLIVIGFGLIWVLAIFANLLLAWFGSFLERLLGLGGSQVLAARLVAPILMILIVALFYKILPETKVAWRDVWLGASISTALILAALFLVGLFFQVQLSKLGAAGNRRFHRAPGWFLLCSPDFPARRRVLPGLCGFIWLEALSIGMMPAE